MSQIEVGKAYASSTLKGRSYTVEEIRRKGRGHTVIARANNRSRTRVVESLTRFCRRVSV